MREQKKSHFDSCTSMHYLIHELPVVDMHAPKPSYITNELPGPGCVAHQHHSSVQLCKRVNMALAKNNVVQKEGCNNDNHDDRNFKNTDDNNTSDYDDSDVDNNSNNNNDDSNDTTTQDTIQLVMCRATALSLHDSALLILSYKAWLVCTSCAQLHCQRCILQLFQHAQMLK